MSCAVSIKPGVKLNGMAPQLVLALLIARDVYAAYGVKYVVVTSCTEGKHSRASLHYVGHAIDLRSRGIDVIDNIVAELRGALGPEFDVVKEADHLHIEWQPKEG